MRFNPEDSVNNLDENLYLIEEDSEIIRCLSKHYPRVFLRIQRLFNAGKLVVPKYINIPNNKGRLKFEVEQGRVRVSYIKPKDLNFTEKFQSILAEICAELDTEKKARPDYRRSLTEYGLSKAVAEQIEETFQERYKFSNK